MTIIVKQLSKTYDTGTETIRVLNRLDLTMEKGTWATIIGPSGSGKSTLLKCVGGLEKPDTGGEITFDGWHLATAKRDELAAFRRKKVGFIFQDYKLFEQFTVLDNVMLPLIPYEQKERLKKKAIAILEMLGLDRRLHHYPAQLSGGEKQRTAIARAMINSPGLLICDEPTGNLDRKNRDGVLATLKVLHQEGHSILFVTHDPEISFSGDVTYRLEDGRLQQISESDSIIPVR